MIHVVMNDLSEEDISRDFIWRIADKALNEINLTGQDVSIVMTTNEKILQLNRKHRKMDAPTDVLSFSMNQLDPESGKMYLGDVIISAEKALQQAQDIGHSLEAETANLVIHGLLHLAGYDDEEKEERNKMLALQKEIFIKIYES